MQYYVIEEDSNSEYKLLLGDIAISPKERKAMFLGEDIYISAEPLLIPLKYRRKEEMSDYLSIKFPFVSHDLMCILKANVNARVFYKPTFLLYDGREYPYYYILPPKSECINFKNSKCEIDENMPGGIRIIDGFTLREDVVKNIDIFRVEGLSNRKLVISGRLRKILEENKVKGIQYIESEMYKDF
ncbi:MAG: hypothetical protein N2645_05040 [Clostridia bacterium]|nr:hypothetical protein [Clostridia bacterium]